jgi:hypothetical protein
MSRWSCAAPEGNGESRDAERSACSIRDLLTIRSDHDIVDGASATRFLARLNERMAGGFGLYEYNDRAVQTTPEDAQAFQ